MKDGDRIEDEELERMRAEFRDARDKIKRLMGRVAEDTVDFVWERDRNKEHVIHTKAWKELVPGLWARSIDTVSDLYSVIAYSAAGGVHIPAHYHPNQTETMFVVEGSAILYVDGKRKDMHENSLIDIEKGMWHSFMTIEPFGAIVKYVPRSLSETQEDSEVM